MVLSPDDPDSKHRFKMAFESRKYGNKLAVACSEDGLIWKESSNNPVGPGFEMAGDRFLLATLWCISRP